MQRLVITKDYHTPRAHRPVGVTMMQPKFSLPLKEIVKRFTLEVLDEMESRSLLNYQFSEDEKLSNDQLLDLVDVRREILDFTDIPRVLELAQRQIDENLANAKAKVEAEIAAAAAKAEEERAFNEFREKQKNSTPEPTPEK